MPHVFVNGISAKSGGGRSVLTNLLKAAAQADDPFRYSVAVPTLESYEALASERVRLIDLGKVSHTAMIPIASAITLPRVIRELGCDLVLNLADIPIVTPRPQILLFDWSYAAFPDSHAWRRSSPSDRVVRWCKLAMFKLWLHHIDTLVAQNDTIAEQLRRLYHLTDVPIVQNAVSLDHFSGGAEYDFQLGGGFKLLCLSAYYSHKNIEAFIPVGLKIRDLGLDVKIITTIAPNQNPAARKFLEKIRKLRLDDVIVNVGSVPMRHVPSIYRQTDALLLPTLLESFSGTYVEAMHYGKPILTSDLPFAHAVCGNAAFYFDPLDTESILRCILKVTENPVLQNEKRAIADNLLRNMPTWEAAYRRFTELFARTLTSCLR